MESSSLELPALELQAQLIKPCKLPSRQDVLDFSSHVLFYSRSIKEANIAEVLVEKASSSSLAKKIKLKMPPNKDTEIKILNMHKKEMIVGEKENSFSFYDSCCTSLYFSRLFCPILTWDLGDSSRDGDAHGNVKDSKGKTSTSILGSGSVGSLTTLSKKGKDKVDQLLLLAELALAIREHMGNVFLGLYPILLGPFSIKDRAYAQFPMENLQQLSQKPSNQTKEELLRQCLRLGIPLSKKALSRSIKDVICMLVDSQDSNAALALSGLGEKTKALNAAAEQIAIRAQFIMTKVLEERLSK